MPGEAAVKVRGQVGEQGSGSLRFKTSVTDPCHQRMTGLGPTSPQGLCQPRRSWVGRPGSKAKADSHDPASAQPLHILYFLQPGNTIHVYPFCRQESSRLREHLVRVQVQRGITKPVCGPQAILPSWGVTWAEGTSVPGSCCGQSNSVLSHKHEPRR